MPNVTTVATLSLVSLTGNDLRLDVLSIKLDALATVPLLEYSALRAITQMQEQGRTVELATLLPLDPAGPPRHWSRERPAFREGVDHVYATYEVPRA